MIARHPGLRLGVIALTLALSYGIWYAYSVFLVALLREFGWQRSLLAGAFSVFALVQGTINPILGMLCDRTRPQLLMLAGGILLGTALFLDSFIARPWQLYVGFGLFTAVGVSLCGWVPSLVLVQRRHATRLGLALGIISAGVGVGMVVVVPMCQWFIDQHGWRATFRLLAAVTVLWVVPAALILLRADGRGAAVPVARPASSPSAAPGSLAAALRAPAFWLLVVAFYCGTFCSQTLHVHQVAFLVDHGISPLVAASVVGMVGLTSVFGKIGSGWLSDRLARELVYISCVGVMVLSTGALWLAGRGGHGWGIPLYAIMLGLGYSATAALTPAMMSDRFAGPRFGTLVGLGLFASAAGSASGPWLAGMIFDLRGSYALALIMAGGVGSLAGLCGWLAYRQRIGSNIRPALTADPC